MLHYLLASEEVSPVFEWIERAAVFIEVLAVAIICLLYTSPSPRD